MVSKFKRRRSLAKHEFREEFIISALARYNAIPDDLVFDRYLFVSDLARANNMTRQEMHEALGLLPPWKDGT